MATFGLRALSRVAGAANKFPCFVGNPAAAGALKQRFKLELSDEQARHTAHRLRACAPLGPPAPPRLRVCMRMCA